LKHVIIGTAGHVDHGKTSLIQALTGTNTDRLKEEQDRGMTIDIGFASIQLPDGTRAGIVDVPGHERFLKNMLAGATGVDVALIVIAADEGIMPQTREHLDILKLLQVQNGVVAVTKCDLVDRDWIEVVDEDIKRAIAETPFAGSPIVHVSSVTRKGLEVLKKNLMSAVSRCTARSADLQSRLPIDRVFTRPGFGTVVTGTLASGTLRPGDTIAILPAGIETRIRGLQIHNQKSSEALAGCRVAVNLAGVDVADISRGAQLASRGAATAMTSFDATLQPVDAAALKHRMRVRLHIGTAEIIGRISLLNDIPTQTGTEIGTDKTLERDNTLYIQFNGEEPFAAAKGDRFILRTYSPAHTVGGGVVLAANPSRHKRNDAEEIARLRSLEAGSDTDKIKTLLLSAEFGLNKRDVAAKTGLDEKVIVEMNQELADAGVLVFGDHMIEAVRRDQLADRVSHVLTNYHEKFPLRAGMPREELRTSLLKGVDNRTYNAVLQALGETLRSDAGVVALPTFKVTLNERQKALLERIREFYQECGVASPEISDVARLIRAPADAVSALLKLGVEENLFVCLSDGVYLTQDVLNKAKEQITNYCTEHGSISVAEFRDLIQSNRKYSMQLLEYLDSIHYTRRVEDRRTVA
jgi:selenocysteine-specific elongation factor